MRLIIIDRSCANSPVCCGLTTPGSAPPHSKRASSIRGGFLPKTRWYALYPLSLTFDALAWFTASQSSSKSVHVCAVLCHLVVDFLPIFACTFCLAIFPRSLQWGVTSSLVPSLSTFSAKISEHRLRCWSTTRMRGLPCDRNQQFLYAFLGVSPDWSRRGKTRCRPVHQHTMFMQAKCAFRVCLRRTGQVRQRR